MKKRSFWGIIGFPAILVFSLSSAQPVIAANIAVFGNNSIDNFLAANGNTVTLVDIPFLEKPLYQPGGSLSDFDIFIYTREWGSFGSALSPMAADNVKAFVTGNVVLFMSDMADMIGSSEHAAQALPGEKDAEKALLNAVNFVSQNGRGYIGEFNGAAVALSSNTSGKYGGLALGLVQGTFTGLKYEPDPNYHPLSNSLVDIVSTTHPVVAGLQSPWDLMGGLEYIFTSQLSDPAYLIANWTEGPGGAGQYPAIIATPAPLEPVGVMEPASFFSLLGGLAGLASISRRNSPRKERASRTRP